LIDFDRSEKDHSSRFRALGPFAQPGSKPEVINALASSLLYLGHPTFEMRGGTSGSCRPRVEVRANDSRASFASQWQVSPERAPTQSGRSGSRPMAWWTRAARCCPGFWKWWQSRTRSTVTPSSDRLVQVGLHRQSSVQENARFRDGQIVSASAAAALDAGTSDYDSYPVMALIISETRVRERLARLTPVQWAELQDLCASAIPRLRSLPTALLTRRAAPMRARHHR
jgi:hypothetical protein